MRLEFIDKLGSDLTTVNTARVSFNKQVESLADKDGKLITYLAEHGHWSPFAHPILQLRVTMPIFLARQYFKHTVGSTKNEISRRYVDTFPDMWNPEVWRTRPQGTIKQGSGEECNDQNVVTTLYNEATKKCVETYETMLRIGVAPEQARAVLPQAMYTSIIDTGSLAYWARMYKQRTDSHAQKEWKPLMDSLYSIAFEHFPLSWEALTAEVA